jgi:hypothetical protein
MLVWVVLDVYVVDVTLVVYTLTRSVVSRYSIVVTVVMANEVLP